jgi:hypothetical protein
MMTIRLACLLLAVLVPAAGAAGPQRGQKAPPVPGPMLDAGLMTVDTPEFSLELVRSSQTVAALKPKGSGGFDFSPGDLLVERSHNGLNAILGYMPTLPHWGYNGSARRYWDFLYAGKLRRIERQLHHYGSGLNAIPVLSEFRAHPDDDYLLRAGYGGLMGALTSIDEE